MGAVFLGEVELACFSTLQMRLDNRRRVAYGIIFTHRGVSAETGCTAGGPEVMETNADEP